MTKISNQYSLTNVLFADTTNGRVGVNNTSPSVALDVTGAGKFSGAITANIGSYNPSFIAIGSSNGNGQIQLSSSSNYSIGAGTDFGGMGLYVGGAYRTYILNNGNVGIGTTSPVWMLEINKDTTSGSTGGYPAISVNNPNAAGYAGYYFYAGTTQKGGIEYSNSANSFSFYNNGAERMRITSGGNVLIGTTTDSSSTWKLQVNSLIATLGTDAALVYQNRNDSTRYTFYATGGISYFFNGGNIAQINMSNGAYTALSDVNKKKDFEQSNIGLNEVLQLKPTLYRMKTDSESSSKELGFIAQEVKDLIPQAYVESNDGDDKFIGLNQMPLIAALTKAIQELSADLTSAKQEIELLKAK